ncbi:helix-turn-helix domain-containing protein [Halobacillus sp. GSS1]|uniref:helix-turn-helix domain-containing protein n=1 Tax=Halobacillus sp. GSS1 TaxID=2815919 RepID=UPI001A8EF62D|nr:helix-turn-helix domain-containing protein [Halobacillus sp. GSS1]MBN9655993.1 helix-turn-helix domain-containing protein [Halobacillus sp. GSS1]
MTIYLSKYSTFNSVEEMNHQVSAHEKAQADELTATMRTVLRFISRYAVKYAGAAHLKTTTIAESIGKTDRTIRRILSRLEALGIIERIPFMRKKSGGSGANIIRILPYMSERMSDREVEEKARPTTVESDNLRKETLPKRKSNNTLLDTRSLRQSIPESIYNVMAPFFNAEELYEVYGVLLRAKASVDRSIRAEDHTEYIDAFLACVRRYKARKVRKLTGYLYRSWVRVSRRIILQEMADSVYN